MLSQATATWIPSSPPSGAGQRFSAPITLVVIPAECQSIPITEPNRWNQRGGQDAQKLIAPVVMDDSSRSPRPAGHPIANNLEHVRREWRSAVPALRAINRPASR